MDSHVLWSASPPNLAPVLTGTAPVSALCFDGESQSYCPQSTPKQPQNHSVGGREFSDDRSYPKYIYIYIFFLPLPLSPLFPLVCVSMCECVCSCMCRGQRTPLVLSHRHCPPFYSDRSFSLPWDTIKSR